MSWSSLNWPSQITNLPSQRAGASQAPTQATGPKRFCLCKLEAVRRITQKEGINQGKAFYKCPKNQPDQCSFFEVCWIRERLESAQANKLTPTTPLQWEDQPVASPAPMKKAPAKKAKAAPAKKASSSYGRSGASSSYKSRADDRESWGTISDGNIT
jgi:hypothetical protein